jgi:hypothetical protein
LLNDPKAPIEKRPTSPTRAGAFPSNGRGTTVVRLSGYRSSRRDSSPPLGPRAVEGSASQQSKLAGPPLLPRQRRPRSFPYGGGDARKFHALSWMFSVALSPWRRFGRSLKGGSADGRRDHNRVSLRLCKTRRLKISAFPAVRVLPGRAWANFARDTTLSSRIWRRCPVLAAALALAACTNGAGLDVPIGRVDHSCAVENSCGGQR